MDMNGNKHYVAIELNDDLFAELEEHQDSTATIFIPYTNKVNDIVHEMVRKFGRRLQVLEMNMAMRANRTKIANKYIHQYGGVWWKSSQ